MNSSRKDSHQMISLEDEEEIKKKFIYQTEKLKLLLQVPKDARTEQLCREIGEIAGQIKFLSTYKSKPDFLELCKNLYVKTFDKRQYIFKQGDQGDAFYVILNGSVKVFIDEPTAYKNFMQLKEIAQLNKGDAFGEISLLYNSKRTATVIASERSDLIVLEKEAFSEFIKTASENSTEMKTVHLNRLLYFLESLPVFAMFNKDLLVQISTKCMIQQYPSQTILLKQGVEPSQMFIIRSGRVKAIKKVKVSTTSSVDHLFTKMKNESRVDLFGSDQYYEIDELGDGDIFGDYALLNEQESECSYITAIPSEIISISAFNLRKIVPADTLEVYARELKRYPEDQDLLMLYDEKQDWDRYKKKLISNVLIEKQNKKGFDSRLRLPELKSKHITTPINIIDIKTRYCIIQQYLEDKISTGSDTRKRINVLQHVKGNYRNLVSQLEEIKSDVNIANSFQRKLKKLGVAK